MLRTAFIGSDNLFDKYVCHWLAHNSDLRLIIWTDRLEWSAGPNRLRKIARRYRRRARRFGWMRALDEIFYYVVYSIFFRRREARRLRALLESTAAVRGLSMDQIERIPPIIREIRPESINDPVVAEAIDNADLDAIFSMCIDVILPETVIDAPRLGSFLWHEGITPEYRGVHSPFWALVNEDYDKLGCTLLKMNMKVDAGTIFVQRPVEGIDPLTDSANYIGHKAILDSLDDIEPFMKQLELKQARPLDRNGAPDRLYSYPTASGLAKIYRQRRRARKNR
jgi:folate-dependent phosphoribosylglycinamide formyltransferase PurN